MDELEENKESVHHVIQKVAKNYGLDDEKLRDEFIVFRHEYSYVNNCRKFRNVREKSNFSAGCRRKS